MVTAEKTRLYPTRIDLPAEARAQLVELLNQSLADTLDLKTQVKQAHWNVKGMHFIALHEMFDTFASTLENYVDMLAERVTALGGHRPRHGSHHCPNLHLAGVRSGR
jgi:starvation-inducible DNA-binding protein